MKAIKFFPILALVFAANVILADNKPEIPGNYNNAATAPFAAAALFPVAPKEADFEEVDLSYIIPMPASFFKKVLPTVPRYADFDDDILPVHVGKLIPVIPAEADY